MRKLLVALLLLKPTLVSAVEARPDILPVSGNVDTLTFCYAGASAYPEGGRITASGGQIYICLRSASLPGGARPGMRWEPMSGNPASGGRQW